MEHLRRFARPVTLTAGLVVTADAVDALGTIVSQQPQVEVPSPPTTAHLPENGRVPGPPWTTPAVSGISAGFVSPQPRTGFIVVDNNTNMWVAPC
jgi:hypothetical protein